MALDGIWIAVLLSFRPRARGSKQSAICCLRRCTQHMESQKNHKTIAKNDKTITKRSPTNHKTKSLQTITKNHKTITPKCKHLRARTCQIQFQTKVTLADHKQITNKSQINQKNPNPSLRQYSNPGHKFCSLQNEGALFRRALAQTAQITAIKRQRSATNTQGCQKDHLRRGR